MKIYVEAAVEALRKKERQGETQETIKIDALVSPPPLNANGLFACIFFNLTLCMTKLGVLTLSFPDLMDISFIFSNPFGPGWPRK
jgi:hypothetical protein